jgi:hypothetical protein
METLWCCDPSAEWVANPSPDQVVGYMRQDYDTWGPYSPMIELGWHEHPPQAVPTTAGLGGASLRDQLLVVRHPERGWFFEYSSYRGAGRWLVPHNQAANQADWVEHWACGEETCFLVACFVGQAAGEQIVADFIVTKGPSPVVTWVPFESITPRLEWTEWRRLQRQRRQGRKSP